jgi:two-component system phosphate regulon sensor histidine kinase PhoR
MKRRILLSMCALILLAVLLCALAASRLMYDQLLEAMKQNVRGQANYIAAALDAGAQNYLETLDFAQESNRITLITQSGEVTFESDGDADKMDNHLARPEVAAALETGTGDAVRRSDTLGQQTYYYALRLDNGSVLRVASTISRVDEMNLNFVLYMLLIALAVMALAMAAAGWQSARIVKALGTIDLSNPLADNAYDELSPLLLKIAKQNEQLEAQMAKLREKQDEFVAITQNMREGLIVLDAKRNVLSINKSALALFSVRNLNLRDKHIMNVNRSEALERATESAARGVECEETLRIAKRSYRITASPVMVKDSVRGIVLLIIDISSEQNAQQKRREFTANVSHELKTPLTTISGYAEIMKDGLVKPGDMPAFAVRIYDESQHLIALVEDIIKLSQLDEGAGLPQAEPVELLQLAYGVAQRLSAKAEASGVNVTVTGDEAQVLGIRRVLDEIIFNLLDNAIKYNREGGSAKVEIHHDGDDVRLIVSDTGLGIPEEHQPRVFERFYRADKSHSRQTGGTGLGLSIVKHGAMLHGAKVELESRENRGTRITVTFRALV